MTKNALKIDARAKFVYKTRIPAACSWVHAGHYYLKKGGIDMGAHHWRFFRAGGMDQVQLRTGADLLALDQLDQKLWMALACPVSGIEFDQRTLELIDERSEEHTSELQSRPHLVCR